MKGKKLFIYIGFTLLMIILSFGIYYGFSEVKKTDIQNIGFSFTILAESIFFTMIYFSTNEKNSTFLKAGIVSSSSIYIILAFILNVLLKGMFEKARILFTMNIVLLLLYVGVILLTFLVKKER